jgi:hypothetical protein
MNQSLPALFLLALILTAGCARGKLSPTPESTNLSTSSSIEVVVPTSTEASDVWADIPYTSLSSRYQRHSAILSDSIAAQLEIGPDLQFRLTSGPYTLTFTDHALILHQDTAPPITLALSPLGWSELALLPYVQQVTTAGSGAVQLTGDTGWAEFRLRLSAPGPTGLFHYRLDLIRYGDPSSAKVEPEWRFVNLATGEEASGHLTLYAAPAPMAAPIFYGFSSDMDTTLLYWVDLSELNPFMQAAHYTPSATPGRQGQMLGHNINYIDLRYLPLGQALAVYDSYLYLAPGEPDSETAMFKRYLNQVSDIYDFVAVPEDPLPDWQSLAVETLSALQDPDTWVELDGQRYWRAYVSDTRMSAEAITQLDVGLAAARYAARYGEDEDSASIIDDSINALQNFYNPNFGLIQNSGPIALSGDQGRGDTWYELGHVLKAAEWGVLGESRAGGLALESQAAWMDFAHAVDYQFPQFYNFNTWQGTGREPDVSGGYALYMLRLADLGCGEPCVEEAKAAVQAFPGSGFSFAYETHMTAASALATAELANITGDPSWYDYAYGPIANLIRLSWLYEVDYGKSAPARTFFGLAPTQRAAAITPKEQYEAWIYLGEFLELAHGQIDPSVEKLVTEFYYHSLITLAYSLPPLLSEDVATEHPAAYETVGTNRLDLYIPLEDLGDGWTVWGAIGQEVYGAGMAPTFAALAYVEIEPGIVVYSGYPLVEIDGLTVTLAGIPGTHTQVKVFGIAEVFDAEGSLVDYWACDTAICFQAEGGGSYTFRP